MTKTKKSVQTRRHATMRGTAAGREIIGALTDLRDALASGKSLDRRQFTVRTVEVPDPPSDYDSAAVVRTREMLGVSQPVFAQLLGVSAIQARSWENGA